MHLKTFVITQCANEKLHGRYLPKGIGRNDAHMSSFRANLQGELLPKRTRRLSHQALHCLLGVTKSEKNLVVRCSKTRYTRSSVASFKAVLAIISENSVL